MGPNLGAKSRFNPRNEQENYIVNEEGLAITGKVENLDYFWLYKRVGRKESFSDYFSYFNQ